VTSPPYWGLRDYGNADQLGLEPTPEAYVAGIVAVCRELARVLKPTGTLWLNLGDSYAGGGQTGRNDGGRPQKGRGWAEYDSKNLVGIPWRVAFALQAEGWYLRADIIWAKPNPMPESVTDRPTKAHEYLFLLTKRERYYYDAAAIAEGVSASWISRWGSAIVERRNVSPQGMNAGSVVGESCFGSKTGIRNKRSVWTIPTMPYAGAHFATFPEALVEPCILAGSPLGGLVLDPFLGSGTVGAVAERLSRRWVGTDLAYHDLATERTAQRGFRFEFAEAVS
jgi:DNA modification methylase